MTAIDCRAFTRSTLVRCEADPVSSHPYTVMLFRGGAVPGLHSKSQTKHMKEALFLFLMAVTWQGSASAADIYVSPAGRDSNSSAKARPLASLAAAQQVAR